MAEIGIARGAPPQVALAFLVRRPALFAIPEASRASRTPRKTPGAGTLVLSEDEVRRIDAAFPRERGQPRSLPMG
ncbi:MAG: hypothetical protein U1F37_09215 [Alphaproteobacteria bacterium]